MKKIQFIAFLILLSSQACKDANEEIKVTEPNAGLVTSTGSFWVYQWFSIDTNGTETEMNLRDSIYVSGDTIINDYSYTIFKEVSGSSQRTRFYRDSSGFIISDVGERLWNTKDTGIISSWTDNEFTFSKSILNLSQNIDVLGQTKPAIMSKTTACRLDGKPISECEQCQSETSYYVKNIGEVLEQTAYIGVCSRLEKRLVKYQLQ